MNYFFVYYYCLSFYRNRFSDVSAGRLKETRSLRTIASIGSDRYLGDIDCYVSIAMDCTKSRVNSSDSFLFYHFWTYF